MKNRFYHEIREEESNRKANEILLAYLCFLAFILLAGVVFYFNTKI